MMMQAICIAKTLGRQGISLDLQLVGSQNTNGEASTASLTVVQTIFDFIIQAGYILDPMPIFCYIL